MQSVIKNSGKASASARMLMPEATTQVTLHDVDRFPVALREKILQKQDLTSRTISSYDHILYRARPSLAVSSACVHCLCVCVCAVRAVSMLWSPSATSFWHSCFHSASSLFTFPTFVCVYVSLHACVVLLVFWHSNCFVTGCLSPPSCAYPSIVKYLFLHFSSPTSPHPLCRGGEGQV